MRRIVLLALVAALPACPSDDAQDVDAGACPCTPPTALQVSYDNLSSLLGAANVQDAVDELAARPVAESPVADRVELVVATPANPGLTDVFLTLQCPMPTDVALGGSCGPMNAGTLIGFSLSEQGISCNYSQTAGNTFTPSIRVTCLHRAP